MLILCFKIPPIVEEIAQWLRPGFDSQHRHGGAQPSITSAPADPTSPQTSMGSCTHIVHTHTQGYPHTLIHTYNMK